MFRNIGYFILLISFIFVGSVDYASNISDNNLKQVRPTTRKEVQKPKITESGIAIYQKNCLSCHQKDGSGVPNTYPPLNSSNWVKGDKKKLIMILLNGLQGEITVNDDVYNGIMPKQDKLTDNQIASVLTYIRQNLENKANAVVPKEVKILRVK